jgi:hypothetical protein
MKIKYYYRYDGTMKINFPVDIEDDSELYYKINNKIKEILGDFVDIDWRDPRVVHIYNICSDMKTHDREESLIKSLEEFILKDFLSEEKCLKCGGKLTYLRFINPDTGASLDGYFCPVCEKEYFEGHL